MAKHKVDFADLLRAGADAIRKDVADLSNGLESRQREGLSQLAAHLDRFATDFGPIGESMLDLPYCRDAIVIARRWKGD